MQDEYVLNQLKEIRRDILENRAKIESLQKDFSEEKEKDKQVKAEMVAWWKTGSLLGRFVIFLAGLLGAYAVIENFFHSGK